MRSLLLLAAAGLVLACAAPAHAGSVPRVPATFLGVSWAPPLYEPAVDTAAEVRLMRESGVGTVRFPLYWDQAQPYASASDVTAGQQGRFRDEGGVPTDWSAADLVVRRAAERGLAVLPVILRSPRWAARDPNVEWSPPRDPAQYGRFAAAAVRRYGPSGSFWSENPGVPRRPVRQWQIWNEPGQRFFWAPQAEPARYVALLKTARRHIRQADGGARIVLGGLNEFAWRFLERLYRAGARGHFDVGAVHPFTREVPNVITIIRRFREAMNARGDRRLPLAVTEMSWPSIGRGNGNDFGFEVSEAEQAKKVAQLLPALARERRRLGLSLAVWETWVSYDRDRSYSFDFSGLRAFRGGRVVAKPAYAAWRKYGRRLTGR